MGEVVKVAASTSMEPVWWLMTATTRAVRVPMISDVWLNAQATGRTELPRIPIVRVRIEEVAAFIFGDAKEDGLKLILWWKCRLKIHQA